MTNQAKHTGDAVWTIYHAPVQRKAILKKIHFAAARLPASVLAFFAAVLAGFAGSSAAGAAGGGGPWRGVHLWLDNDHDARALAATLPALAAAGANAVVVEVNYSFEFESHPELRNTNFITRATAHVLAAAARQSRIRLIPEFNCLGHQSFGGKISPLLRVHPEFNETPSLSITNPNVYCLEWCPSAPGLNPLVFSLIDELAKGFEADAVHVGMDEVYLIGADECPRCRGKDPARLYAGQVRALYHHIVEQRHLQMLMWADRLIGPDYQGRCRYDNPHNDLSAALDLVPKNIVECDWHYEWKTNYPSVPLLAGRGFPVWPAGFLPLKAAGQFSDFALAHRSQVVGYLATTWTETSITNLPNWPPIAQILPQWRPPGPK